MTQAETRISLVGWGSDQMILHRCDEKLGVSIWRGGRLRSFGATPWLQGCVAIIKPPTVYDHTRPCAYDRRTVLFMRREAMRAARASIMERDIFLLSEAVITTYTAQQMMGGELLPNCGEIGKRYTGPYGIYLFQTPDRTKKFLNGVLST